MFDTRVMRSAAALALALVGVACGKKADSGGDAQVPEVSAAGVPDVPSGSSGDAPDADERELARYRLTMSDMRKLVAAQEKMKQLTERHPERAKNSELSSDAFESLDALEAHIERIPGAREALRDAGLDVRQYAVMTITFLQAAVAQMAIQQGQSPDSAAREVGIHPDNLRFLKEHEAELAKLKHLVTP